MTPKTVGMLFIVAMFVSLVLACGGGSSDSTSKGESQSTTSSSQLMLTASWTKEAIPAAFLVPDDFPDGWKVQRDPDALTIRGLHTEFLTAKQIEIDFEIHDTPMAARQRFDQSKADAQSTIDGRGISGDKLEDVKHKQPLLAE